MAEIETVAAWSKRRADAWIAYQRTQTEHRILFREVAIGFLVRIADRVTAPGQWDSRVAIYEAETAAARDARVQASLESCLEALHAYEEISQQNPGREAMTVTLT